MFFINIFSLKKLINSQKDRQMEMFKNCTIFKFYKKNN